MKILTLKKVYFTCLSIGILFQVFAQKSEAIKLDPTDKQIVKYIEFEEGRVFRVFSEETKSNDVQQGIIYENGSELEFPNQEVFFGTNYSSIILSCKIYDDLGKTSISVFQAHSNSLKLLSSKTLMGIWPSVVVTLDKIIMSDFWEGSGKQILVTDIALNKLFIIEPASGDFYNKILMDASGSNLTIFFKNQGSRVINCDLKTGLILTDNPLTEEVNFFDGTISQTKAYLKSANGISCFDLSGNQLWAKELSVSRYPIFVSPEEKRIVAFTRNGFELLNANGQLEFSKSHSELFPDGSKIVPHQVKFEEDGDVKITLGELQKSKKDEYTIRNGITISTKSKTTYQIEEDLIYRSPENSHAKSLIYRPKN